MVGWLRSRYPGRPRVLRYTAGSGQSAARRARAIPRPLPVGWGALEAPRLLPRRRAGAGGWHARGRYSRSVRTIQAREDGAMSRAATTRRQFLVGGTLATA